MNNTEAKAMRGTRFDYIVSSGSVIPCYIAEVDLTVGLTCKVWKDTEVRMFPSDRVVVADENSEVICYNLEKRPQSYPDMLGDLVEIRDTGILDNKASNKGNRGLGGVGGLQCAF